MHDDTTPTGGAPATPELIYLLIGQSNMAGRAPIEDEDVPAPDGVLLFNAEDSWEPATNQPLGLNRFSTVEESSPKTGLNCGRTFGQRLVAETGRTIGLVVNARGATRIEQWRRTGHTGERPLYRQAVSRASAALAATPNAVLAGIIWHQGEGDNKPEAADYYLSTLADIVDGLRTELDTPDAAFVAAEVGSWRDRGQDINPLIRRVPDVIGKSAWVSSDGLTTHETDESRHDPERWGPHFDAPSQRLLGTRYADAVLTLTGRV